MKKIYTLFVLVVCCTSVIAQEQFAFNTQAEKDFLDAVILFEQQQYYEAAEQFEQLSRLSPIHQRTTASYIMAAKAYLQLQAYQKALLLIDTLSLRFPTTQYQDELYFISGLANAMLGNYRDAVIELCLAVETTDNMELTSQVDSVVEVVASTYLSVNVIDEVLRKGLPRKGKELLEVILAERQYRSGNLAEAQKSAEKFLKNIFTNKYRQRLIALMEKIKNGLHIKIGILLPLTQKKGRMQGRTIGEDLLEGISVAFDEYKTRLPSALQVAIEVYDLDRDTARAKEIVEALAAQPDVVAVIGPLYSSTAMSCAPIANDKGLPMILPVANAYGLTASGSYVFQLNPDFSVHGSVLARYAVQNLKMSSIAALAPETADAKLFVESFVREAKTLGAKVLAVEYYSEPDVSLHEQFLAIRKASLEGERMISFAGKFSQADIMRIIRAGANPHIVDSLIAINGLISATKLFGPNGVTIAESLRLKMHTLSQPYDALDIPVTSLDGLVLPIIDATHIGVVASQLAYFNFKTQVLGSPEWNDLAELESHGRYINGVIFPSESYFESDSTVDNFQKRQKQWTKYTLYGYDCMNLVLGKIVGGAVTRGNLASALSATEKFHGKAMTISFISSRVNSSVHILQYKDGGIKKIYEFD